MSLRSRTLLILLVSLVVVMGTLYGVLNHYIFTAFAKVEQVHFNKLGNQVARTIETRQHYFDAFVRDWAIWNDSYQFVEDQNDAFVENNIDLETLTSIETLCIVYFDKNFNVVYRFSAPEDETTVSKIVKNIQRQQSLIEATDLRNNSSFYLCIKEFKSPFLAAMHPVIPTDNSKPANGYLLMGTLVNHKFSEQVSLQAGYDFDLVKVCDQHCRDSKPTANGHINVVSHFLDEESAQMFLMVHDIQEHCSFKLVTTVYREMNVHLIQVFRVTLVVIIIMGLLGILIVEKTLSRLVTAPISHQIHQLNNISDSGDLTQRFDEKGSGELLLLSQTSNRMLEKISHLNQSLHLASETDSLTGLWNRRRFDKQLDHEWQLAIRNNTSVSLLMVDVDHFKVYNDTYGHQEGDSCLQQVATTISKNMLRTADIATRYGGEEFAVILPDIEHAGAMKVAERIREAVALLQIANRDAAGEKFVTISVGVATLSANKHNHYTDVVRMADQALYRAKESGRNCSKDTLC